MLPFTEAKSVVFELTQAIEEDSVSKMSRLMDERGVDVDFKLSFGIPILLKAIRCRSAKVVDYLIVKGCNVECSVLEMMKRLDTLEECQSHVGQYDEWNVQTVMKMLPLLGNRVCSVVDKDGRSLLQLSCFFPDDTIFNYLIKQGADPNYIDRKGISVLSLLISHRDWSASLKMINTILQLPNINVNIRDNIVGSTPLFHSFLIKRLDIFFLLLAHGADPFIKTQAGSTLMHLPFLDSSRLMILHDLGLNVNAKNNAGKRPLQDRQRFDFIFFIMILLGRDVTTEEFVQMEDFIDPNIIAVVKSKVSAGYFSQFKLQSMCRQTIRSVLFKSNAGIVTPYVYCLPIPNPLKTYLDILTYAKNVLSSLGVNVASCPEFSFK